jgi:GNAT superfamily N-acetyltransferase
VKYAVNIQGGFVRIRVAVKKDVVKISNLVKSLSHFYLKDQKNELPEWFDKTLAQSEFLKRIEGSEYFNFVYENEGEIIGYSAMKGSSHLFHLFVSEKYQGKGLARELWGFASNVCVSNIYTLRSSLYAVPAYRKFGFIESGVAGEIDGIGFQPMELRV